MKASPIKNSFNAGELSPLMAGRTDQEKYGSGCSVLQNFLPTTQGPLVRRGGSYFIGEVRNSAHRTWLKDFIFNVTQSYTLEFGDYYIRFYTNRGLVLEAAKSITAATKANPCQITSNAHGFSNGDQVYITGIAGMTQLNSKMYKVAGATTNTFTLQDTDGNAINSTGYGTYTSGGTASRVYTIATPYPIAALTDSLGKFRLKFIQSYNVCYILHPLYPVQKLSRLGNTNWTVTQVDFQNGPFQVLNTDTAKTVYANIPNTAVSGAANNGAGLIRLTVASTGFLATGNAVIVNGVTGTVEANGRWIVTVIDGTHIDLQGSSFSNAYGSGGLVTGDTGAPVPIVSNSPIFSATDVGELFYIEKSNINILPQWAPGITVSNGDRYRSGNNTYIALNGGTTGSVTPTHTSGVVNDGNPGVKWLYSDSGYGIVKVTAYTDSQNITGSIVSTIPYAIVGAVNASYRWAHSLFSNTLGWPEVGTFFRDRLALLKGIQGALSVTSDYENFASKIGGIQTADSSFLITLPTANPPRWAIDANDLIIGTGGDEIAVSEISSASALSATNTRARRQTKWGSAAVEPVLIGFGVLFATRSGQRMRDMRYNWQINGYDSVDLTVLAEHIAKGDDGMQGIVQMCYQQEPYNILWACTSDGKLIAFTYNREQDVQGWHNHPIGGLYNGIGSYGGTLGAFVESVSCIPSPDGTRDDVWLIVKRTINGVTRRYVEYIVPEFLSNDSNIADAFYVDCGLTYAGASTTVISGLYHLKGQTVDVLANGGAHPQVTVSASGTVTLQSAVTKAQIGLPCPARMRTMRMDAGSPLGTAQGKIKRITHIIVRFFKTLGGWYGPDSGKDTNGNYRHMDELQYRQADGPMDTPPPMLSGDTSRLPWPNGEDYSDGFIEIINDTPTPMTIVALMADEVTREY